jgi:hypothetical protein
MKRDEAISQILSVWHQEIGGDVVFKKAYDALWTNGPVKKWSGDEFYENFKWMKMILPKLHPKDLAVIWEVSCKQESKITGWDVAGDYTMS